METQKCGLSREVVPHASDVPSYYLDSMHFIKCMYLVPLRCTCILYP